MPESLRRQRVGFQLPGRVQVPDVGGLFQQQAQPNLFDTINSAIQLRRKNQREAIEDQQVAEKAELESLKTRAEVDKLRKETGAIGASPLAGLFQSDQVPVGTKMTVDSTGKVSYSVPLNRKLTDTEAKTIVAGQQFQTEVDEAIKLIEGGVLGAGGQRVIKQQLAQAGGSKIGRLLTPDRSALEKISSLHSRVKRAAFAEGGKQLTPSEQKIVFAGLDFVGKSDEQIVTDLKRSISVLVDSGKLVAGGAQALQPSQPISVRKQVRNRDEPKQPVGKSGKYKILSVRDK